MGTIIISRTRTAPFLKNATLFKGAGMDDNAPIQELVQEPASGKALGNEKILLTFDNKTNRYNLDEKYLPMEKFKELIPNCNVYDDQGRHIVTANINNRHDPFFTSDEMSVLFEGTDLALDDSVDKNKVFAAFCMGNKKDFKRIDSETDSTYTTQKFQIGVVEDLERSRATATQSEMDVVIALASMSREKMKILCKILDLKNPSDNADDKVIKAKIYDRLKTGNIGRVSRMKWFAKFADMNQDDLQYWNLFIEGKKHRLITLNPEGNYVFKGRALGLDEQAAVDSLQSSGNQDILKDLRKAVSQRTKEGTEPVNIIEKPNQTVKAPPVDTTIDKTGGI